MNDPTRIHPALERRPKRGRPKILSDEEQAHRIVDCALALYMEGGYAGMTMDAVAAACRISKRTLYQFFSGRLELLAAVIEAHRQAMLALPGNYDDLPLTEAIEKIFRIDLDEVAEHGKLAFMQAAIVDARRFPEVRALLQKHGGEAARALLAEWLERQRRRGRAEIGDPESVAEMLMDLIFGAMAFRLENKLEWPGGRDYKAYLRQCIYIFVNGIQPR
jgi:AcrR family transcriptional regulator